MIGLLHCAAVCIAMAADGPEKAAEKTPLGQPFWNSKVMENEPVLFVQEEGKPVATGKLLFKPSGKLKITSPDLKTTYEEGKDYIWNSESGLIELTASSQIIFKTEAQMSPPVGSPDSLPRIPAGASEAYIRWIVGQQGEIRGNTMLGHLHSEGHFFHDLQVQVTYQHEDAFPWQPVPPSQLLTRSLNKLESKKPFKIFAMGDSITQGFNASGFVKVSAPPYQPSYPQLVANTLEKRFGAPITVVNWGRAGSTSSFGFSLLDKAKAENPDLITIAFGMNHGDTAQRFEENMSKLLAAVQEACPEADVILVSPMTQRLPANKFIGYRDVLAKMATTNVAMADVTTPWLEVLKRKSFSDISGNNFNHPNDFGHRLYAWAICELFPAKPNLSAAANPAKP